MRAVREAARASWARSGSRQFWQSLSVEVSPPSCSPSFHFKGFSGSCRPRQKFSAQGEEENRRSERREEDRPQRQPVLLKVSLNGGSLVFIVALSFTHSLFFKVPSGPWLGLGLILRPTQRELCRTHWCSYNAVAVALCVALGELETGILPLTMPLSPLEGATARIKTIYNEGLLKNLSALSFGCFVCGGQWAVGQW